MTSFNKTILFLGLFLVSFCQQVDAQEPITITSWKILGPFMIAPRDGGIDPLQKYGGERNIIPSNAVSYTHLTLPTSG